MRTMTCVGARARGVYIQYGPVDVDGDADTGTHVLFRSRTRAGVRSEDARSDYFAPEAVRPLGSRTGCIVTR